MVSPQNGDSWGGLPPTPLSNATVHRCRAENTKRLRLASRSRSSFYSSAINEKVFGKLKQLAFTITSLSRQVDCKSKSSRTRILHYAHLNQNEVV